MPIKRSSTARESSDRTAARRVKLKPHDSFDLIRLIARTQSDARKALGELVQNSLDANARRVDIVWFNEKGVRALRIRDDGEGIFPAEERVDALRKLAQTIGHSHKHSLSPAERHQQMVLGKYGIGLLGFWCVARTMEINSRVGGGEVWVLRLEENQPEAEVFRARALRADDEATFTEITLRGVKESVARQIRPARLQAYLASELRGQLLQRGALVCIHDRISRGLAVKEFVVKPRAYLGAAIGDLRVLEVPGHEDARLELYHVPQDEERRGVVSLSCGGSTVLDDLAAVDLTDPTGAAREPWSSGRFEGVVDFPDLEVAPGTRRGFVPNEAALDFLLALEKLEHELALRLERIAHEQAARKSESLAREIRRAFASVARRLPHYDLFDVRSASHGAGEAGATAPPGAALDEPAVSPPRARDGASADSAPVDDHVREEPSLFPPGPLAAVRITPARARVGPSSERRFLARAVDADVRTVEGQVVWSWQLDGAGALTTDGAVARYRAGEDEGDARISASAQQGSLRASASVDVLVRESAAGTERTAGIPEPRAVDAPSEPWRSRIVGNSWEYNQGHRDYLAVRNDEPRRLRYLIHLFAKEIVLRNFGSPQDEELLERMVEVLTHLGDGRARV